jgi:DNA topoisomerase I
MTDKKTLILIESPNKKHCIEKALGTDKYVVMASVGGVYDLPVNKFAIDIENDFDAEYVVTDNKVDVVSKIKKEYKKCKDVILATDLDVEGEGIAWGLAQILNVKKPMRMVYNDTNPKTIQKALNNLVPLNMNKVDTQHCRRYLDRIIGYKLSPLLWKIMNAGGSLSAGRVQSVACRLIMERHFDVEKFFEGESQSYFKVAAEFDKKKYKAILYTSKKNNLNLDSDDDDDNQTKQPSKKGKLQIAKIPKEKDTRSVLLDIHDSTFTVENITEKESIRNPCDPFHTTTVCQEASRKLGMSTERTMNAAQNLFAHGYCTYHRTDSVVLSDDALKAIGKCVVSKYGKDYYREKQYKNKKSGTQGAHECLRVTDPNLDELKEKDKIRHDEVRLYKLIWKRTIASQMAPAKFKIHTAEIDISELSDYKFITEYEECIFDGFLKVYNPNAVASDSDSDNSDSDDDTTKSKKLSLPKKGSKLSISDVVATQDYKKPPAHFDEPSFLGKLKALNIGRPATIKSIISKIQSANYVRVEDVDGKEIKSTILKLDTNGKIKEDKKSIWLGKGKRKFIPTDLGITITKFLMQNFPKIMDYKFTGNMEEKLDEIEEGNIKILDVLNDFYSTFAPLLEKLENNIKVDKLSLKQMKEIGIHPELKYKIYTMMARYGPVVQMLNDDNKVINTAPIKAPLKMDTIKVADAVELFRFPIELGKHEKKSVSLCRGKFGYYIEHGTTNKTRISLKIEDDDVDGFTLDDAIEKINEKKADLFWEGKNETYHYRVLEGQYGKYISAKPVKKNARVKAINCKLPANVEPEKLTLEKVQEIIKNKYSRTKKTDKEKEKKDKDSDDDDDEKPKKLTKKKDDNAESKKPAPKKTPKPKMTKDKKTEMKNMFEVKEKPKPKKVKKEKDETKPKPKPKPKAKKDKDESKTTKKK